MDPAVLYEALISFLPRFAAGLLATVVSFVVAFVLRNRGRVILDRIDADPQLEILLLRTVYVTTLVLGLVIVLGIWGIDVVGLIAGLGVIGLALGFAVRNILENFLAGILLLLQRPFALGDLIEVAGQSGRVSDISLRATTLRTDRGEEAIIPNAKVYSGVIVRRGEEGTD